MATAAARAIRVLTAKKESIFGILQTLLDLSKVLEDPVSKQRFKTLYLSIEKTRNELLEIIDKIAHASLEDDEEFVPNFAILRTIDEMCCYIHSAAERIKTTEPVLPGVTPTPVRNMASMERSLPRLPTMELPQFSGEIREWETFYSIFKSVIHDNESLTKVDKVHYLVGRLKGAALGICSGLAPTGENYDIIWQALIDRYQDKRSLANNYLDQIMDFKVIHGESPKGLRLFLEKFDSAVKALKKLEIDDLSDFILVHQALSKLDSETGKQFERHRLGSTIPTYDEVIKFVQEQSKILVLNRKSNNSYVDTTKTRSPKSFVVSNESKEASSDNKRVITCIFCHKGWHYLNSCGKFRRLTPARRYEAVRDNNWCYNCLSPNHGVRACPSERTCKECGKRHHLLLHTGRSGIEKHAMVPMEQAGSSKQMIEPGGASTSGADTEVREGTNTFCSTSINSVQSGSTVLLSTAVVNVTNSSIKNQTARFLLDSGSQANLLTVKCCKRLGINISKFYSSVQGLGKNSQAVKGFADLIISSRHNSDMKYSVKVFLVDKISERLPRVRIDTSSFSHLEGVQLADDTYYEAREIEGILGAELFPLLMGTGCLSRSMGGPIAIQTTLGYVVMGKVPELPQTPSIQTFVTIAGDLTIEQLISKFWEIEEVPKVIAPDPDDLNCERLYLDTYSRDSTGRFTVALPFKSSTKNLGDSELGARTRLMSLERRLDKTPELRLSYNRVMKDFIEQGHMRRVTPENLAVLAFYIPHHAVLKPESISTPVRVVLDASAPSETGVSLNDLLYGGPKLQTDICTLLINFRLFKIAVTADIRQMYRQINMLDDHCKFQRILWRFKPEDEIQVFELNTVAFGIKSSPYLALRTIKQLVKEEGEKYPLAAKTIDRYLYMDDLVSSVSTVNEAYRLYRESVDLFAAGKFDLTKWSTNSINLLNRIPVDKRLAKTVIFKNDSKILGMQWNPEKDVLTFRLGIPDAKCTKRIMLSTVARCFDPIGLIAPFILYLKLLVKELWRLKLGWDAEPPDSILALWSKLRAEWSELGEIQIPRHVFAEENQPVMLLAFADASNDGYGAVVYLRTITHTGNVVVSLVCAKSKVSPFKMVTIPRLELCAAVLSSKLVRYVANVYGDRLVISKIFAFSDSTIVLQWLKASFWKDIFVANRVAQIRETLPDVLWYHIEGANNPADCLSRGLSPAQLVGHPLWRSGPEWVILSEENWPITQIEQDNSLADEKAILNTTMVIDTHPLLDLSIRCSNWISILRTTVWVLRFLKLVPRGAYISAADLLQAELTLVKLVQGKHFGLDIQLLAAGKPCSAKLRKLRPFVKEGLLRVGGRLGNAELSFSQQHPLILPCKDPLVSGLVDYYHQTNLHTGPHLLEALIRQKFWILAGRSLIRGRVHACNHCFRSRPVTLNPLMADLPAYRVQQSKAFTHTGVDYFGPVNITLGRRRGAQIHKAYVCLFVCMSVKAVHLELVSSLSTAHFMQAFKRFLSRRGPCRVLYSDQGTNFIGAKKLLSELHTFVSSKKFKAKLLNELAPHGIEWRFNPPSAPHMGGIWESNVKSAKGHIFRVIGDQLLTYEEFSTLLAQVECLLNSRPLCRLSADPSAPTALTPSHFLTLSPLNSLPADDVTEFKSGRLDRFQLIDRMVQDLWKRWHLEYLTTLQVREKWDKQSPNIKVGTVVILKCDNSPPLHWPLGIITEVHPGKDGTIRVVTVKTNKGVYRRPVVKVCPLPTQ